MFVVSEKNICQIGSKSNVKIFLNFFKFLKNSKDPDPDSDQGGQLVAVRIHNAAWMCDPFAQI
jgi:hypothetical protein